MTALRDVNSEARDAWLVLTAAALVSPAGFLVANFDRSPDYGKVVLAVGALILMGLAVLGVARILKVSFLGGVEVGVALVVFSSFGLARRWLPGVDGWVFLAIGFLCSLFTGLIVALIGRRAAWLTSAIRWGIYVMAVAPITLLILSGSPAMASQAVDRPVVIVFVDGYAAPSVMADWGLDDGSHLFEELERRGFGVREVAASYSMTYASLGSALEGNFIVDEGDSVDGELRRRLYRTLQGDNSFVARLRAAGYTYTHVESGWTGTRCGDAVDVCVSAPFLEETMWNLLQRTALAVLVEETYGHAFTIGGKASLRWLGQAELPGPKTLIISHVLLPHPPLYLNESCELDYSPKWSGHSVWSKYMGEALRVQRLHRFAAQVACLDEALLDVVDNPTFDDAVIAIVGDHGSDSLGQLRTEVEAWTEPMVEERMTTIGAVRGCDDRPPAETVNILSHVLECVLGVPEPRVPLEQYLVPVEELSRGARVVRRG